MSSRTPSHSSAANHTSHDLDPTEAANNAFLSPRVIDRRAYAELAGELRDLLAQSAAERSALTAVLDQSGRADQDFRSRESAQAVNLDLCAKALKKIDEKTARIESLLSRADEVASAIENVDNRVDTVVAAKIESLEARLAAIQAAAAAKSESLEERLRSASRDLEQRIDAIRRDAECIIAPSTTALKSLVKRAEDIAGTDLGRGPAAQTGHVAPPIPGSLAELIARASDLTAQADQTVERIDSTYRKAERERGTFDAWIADAAARIDALERSRVSITASTKDLTAEAERTIAALRARLSEQENLAENRAVEIRDEARRAIDDLEARLEEGRRDSQTALLGLKPATEQTLGEFRIAVQSLAEQTRGMLQTTSEETRDTARRAADETITRLNSVVADTKARFDAWAAESAGRIETAAAAAHTALHDFKPRADAMLAELRTDGWRAVEEMERRLTAERDKLQSALDEMDSRLTSTREQSQKSLTEMAAHVQTTRNDMETHIQTTRREMDTHLQSTRRDFDSHMQSARRDLEAQLQTSRNETKNTITELKPAADALLDDLRTTVAKAQDAHNTTSLAIRLLDKSAQKADQAMSALKPWQGILLEGDASQIPAPIRRMLDSVRSSMQADLSHIASALRDAAARADKAIHTVDAASPPHNAALNPTSSSTSPVTIPATTLAPRPRGLAAHSAD